MSAAKPQAPNDLQEPSSDRLDSWKEIAAYLKRDERTVRRWEKEGLPVRRHTHKKQASVYAYNQRLMPGGTTVSPAKAGALENLLCGATECSTAHKVLKILALPTVSAIVINDIPHVVALEKLLQLSQNRGVPR